MSNKFGGAPFVYVSTSSSVPQVVRLAEIVDGLSTTIAFSETVQGQQGDLRGFELESHFRIPVYGWMMGRFGNIPVPDAPSREGLEIMRTRAKAADYVFTEYGKR